MLKQNDHKFEVMFLLNLCNGSQFPYAQAELGNSEVALNVETATMLDILLIWCDVLNILHIEKYLHVGTYSYELDESP